MLELAGARNLPKEIYSRLMKNAFSNSLYFQLIRDIADIHEDKNGGSINIAIAVLQEYPDEYNLVIQKGRKLSPINAPKSFNKLQQIANEYYSIYKLPSRVALQMHTTGWMFALSLVQSIGTERHYIKNRLKQSR